MVGLGCLFAADAQAQVPPEVDACRASGLAALKERSPAVEDLTFDMDGLAISKADTKVEDTPIKMVVMGDAYLERKKTEKSYHGCRGARIGAAQVAAHR